MSLISEKYTEKKTCKHCENSKIKDKKLICELRLEMGKSAEVIETDSCGCYERDE